MRRRIVWTTAVLAVLLVVPSVPASAAEFTLAEPDGDVTGATPLEVHLERDFGGERLRRVRVGLEKDGQRLGMPVDLRCQSGCEIGDPTAVFVLPDDGEFDPSTGAPFDIEAPMPNGTYRLRVDLIKDSRFQDDERFDADIHLAVAPSAPKQLAAEVEDREVSLTWKAPPEPDVERYRVERRIDGEWEEISTTSSTSSVDEPGGGTHSYRVVALRSDGRGGSLETASSAKEVEVEPHEDDEAGEGGGNGGNGGDGDGTEEAGTEGGGDDDGNGDGGESDGADTAGQDTSSTESAESGSSSRDRSGAEAPSTGGNRSSIPGVGSGEDGYGTELDYGATGNGEGGDDVMVANPGGFRGAMDQIFDAERVAVPVATGLVLTGLGMHLWRWLRVPLP